MTDFETVIITAWVCEQCGSVIWLDVSQNHIPMCNGISGSDHYPSLMRPTSIQNSGIKQRLR